ncbi:MAG: DNA/RNA nuclease SfsA [Azospira oryzae]|uniref:Sugar fermentation stimulation protein homolog n=1 Tax=Pelomicrobium methylotrophicum TaxID=2602750 RepID=A0A5C7EVL0_9PROT|nr:DNA/RNA nuclease SfsA [Pelomicrobium methylotrophicum]PZP51129.1 MAG: DNA/RNA nuclease SfsA [Azospira oryzae]PZP75497.1 MAG: DNA/RNA nuclease SfsA [Azospira oryzae]TXF12176.1 DNA/RNA nuclease SfsA [Pelomicrobium methylotrophicum]
MKLPSPLIEGRLLRRYKRFLADVETRQGIVTAHCPNTGSLMGCNLPGSRVWLSRADDPARKLGHTWELVEADGVLVGIHTGRSNRLVEEAVANGIVRELQGYRLEKREVRYEGSASRADLLLVRDHHRAYVEVKNVTAAVADGIALFPDAVSSRGTRHLRRMMEVVRAGHRAVLVFCVQRGDVDEVRPADAIDPVYGKALREALATGVEVVAYRARVTPSEIALVAPIPVVCP